MKTVLTAAAITLLAALFAGQAAQAQPKWQISLYAGVQEAFDSDVSGRDQFGTPFDFTAGWDGRSFTSPPYWGARVMRYGEGDWGFGVEFTHAKVYADDATLAASGFSTLEFTDGLNILTANAERRMDLPGRWSARAGLGLGVSIPYVEVTTPGGSDVRQYQLTGPAARWYIGADYALSDRWSVFAEYNGTYSINAADLPGPGELDTNILTNAINLGIGFSF